MIDSSKLEMIATFGQSTHGKSSFINTIAGEIMAQPGDNSGQSTTKQCSFHGIEFQELGIPHCILMDTIGLNDSELDFTNDDILDKIITNVIQNDGFPHTVRTFLIFQSISEGTINIKQTLLNFKKNFSARALKSCIILVTKIDKIKKKKEIEGKLQTLREDLASMSLEHIPIVNWQNKLKVKKTNEHGECIVQFVDIPKSSEEYKNQILCLKHALKKVKEYDFELGLEEVKRDKEILREKFLNEYKKKNQQIVLNQKIEEVEYQVEKPKFTVSQQQQEVEISVTIKQKNGFFTKLFTNKDHTITQEKRKHTVQVDRVKEETIKEKEKKRIPIKEQKIVVPNLPDQSIINQQIEDEQRNMILSKAAEKKQSF